jgi:hypothetical protein
LLFALLITLVPSFRSFYIEVSLFRRLLFDG